MASTSEKQITFVRPMRDEDLDWIARQAAEVHDLRMQHARRDGRLYDSALGLVVEYER